MIVRHRQSAKRRWQSPHICSVGLSFPGDLDQLRPRVSRSPTQVASHKPSQRWQPTSLVILSRRKNSRASNWHFERKKTEYFQHKGVTLFPLTTLVIREPEWTPKVLEGRQRKLVSALSKEWRLD